VLPWWVSLVLRQVRLALLRRVLRRVRLALLVQRLALLVQRRVRPGRQDMRPPERRRPLMARLHRCTPKVDKTLMRATSSKPKNS
jgi:hypothetical protein